MSQPINPEYLGETLAALRAWRRGIYGISEAERPETVNTLAKATDRLVAAPEPAPLPPDMTCRRCQRSIYHGQGYYAFTNLDGSQYREHIACPEPAPRSEAEQAVLEAVKAWYHRPATKDDAPTPEDCALESACREFFGEPTPTHCAMPRCGKAFVMPEPWYFKRGDGAMLPLCHDCHWFVVQPR